MTPDDLKAIQRAGWAIVGADEQSCVVKCTTFGCQMRARFVAGGAVPQRSVPAHNWDRVVRSFDDVREVMKDRRQELGLTIPEVEHISGIASDHLAKFEKTDWNRPPNINTLMSWATALGYEVVLRHGELPPVTLRWIAETRDKVATRRGRFEKGRKRDAQLRRPKDPLVEERARLQRQQDFIARQISQVEDQMRARDQGALFGELDHG